jgi:tRNA 2-thiouridine synthesizing protein A
VTTTASAGANPVLLDATGQRCPLPVIALAKVARGLAAGTVVVVIATDPAARHDVPAWARLRGHDVLEITESERGTWRLSVRIGAARTT